MTRTDTASRTIRATPAALYQALVTAKSLEKWMPPSGMTGEMAEFDPRPGGRYRMILRYDDATVAGKSGGNEDIAEARFVELVPDRLIVQAVDFVSDDPLFQGTMTMSTTLTPLGDETEVRFTAEHVPEGMNSSLENLAKFIEP
jgi:uncharacterized protein YndB with AHSA1/START domain